jgi:hypothetical protein
VARLWIALALLALNLVGVALVLRRSVPWSSLRWRWAAIGLGVVAAACASLIRHRYTDKYFAIGFPLPAAAFEVSTGADFVGPLTLPILCLDALLVGALPLATLIIAALLGRRLRTS